MSLDCVPFKLLEINVMSAQDLPAVSKKLRTFAVAWIHPDKKLSTRIDHQGHTNPTWNYKMAFRVDNKFLRSETSAITIEIYNVAWLRDLPIGTAHLFIKHLSPPLIPNSPTVRSVDLHIRRPSGHLQGILHLGINLTDNSISDSPLRSEMSASALKNQVLLLDDHQNFHEKDRLKDNENKDELSELTDSKFQRQRSVKINLPPYGDNVSSMQGSNDLKSESEFNVKPRLMPSTNVSMVSVMHPLPSEIAVNLKKGFFTAEGNEYGRSIFENWSEPSDPINGDGLRSKNVEWIMEDQIPLTKDHDGHRTKEPEGHKAKDHVGHKDVRPKRRKHSDGGGLFSCFAKGFEFTFLCGSKNMKKNRKTIHHHQKFHADHQNMHMFHI